MKSKLWPWVNALGVSGAFGFSAVNLFGEGSTLIGIISAIVGMFLSIMLGLSHYADYRKKRSEERINNAIAYRKELENKYLEDGKQLPTEDDKLDKE